MTNEILKSILAEYPWLAAMGLNPDGTHTLARCNAAEHWLQILFSPLSKRPLGRTYVMKHEAEETIDYTTDGEFCAAAIGLGFKVTPFKNTAIIRAKQNRGAIADDVGYRMFADEINSIFAEAGISDEAIDAALRAELEKEVRDEEYHRMTKADLLLKRIKQTASGFDPLNHCWGNSTPEEQRRAKQLLARIDGGGQ